MLHNWNQRFRLRTTIAEAGLFSYMKLYEKGRLPIVGEDIHVTLIQEGELGIHFCKATWTIDGLSPERLSKHESLSAGPTIQSDTLPREPGIHSAEGWIVWDRESRTISLHISFSKKSMLPTDFKAEIHELEPVLT